MPEFKLIQLLKSYRKTILFSYILAVIIFLSSYCIYNIRYPIPFLNSIDIFCLLQKRIDKNENKPIPVKFALVNTGLDGVSVSTQGGHTTISDREKIAQFLNRADSLGTYKMIVLDLVFYDSFQTTADTILASAIERTPRVVCVKTRDMNGNEPRTLIDDIDVKKAYNDYGFSFIQSGFTKYQYLQYGEHPSLALAMLEEITPESIRVRKFGPLYFHKGRLFRNSPVLPLRSNLCSYDMDGNFKFSGCSLGEGYLNEKDESFALDIQNEIIIIGDFNNDVHDTYVGSVPGSLLTCEAYEYLLQGRTIYPWWMVILIIFVYASISFAITVNFKGKVKMRLMKYQVITLVASYFSYSMLLSLISIVLYLRMNVILETAFASLIFSLLPQILVVYNLLKEICSRKRCS